MVKMNKKVNICSVTYFHTRKKEATKKPNFQSPTIERNTIFNRLKSF